MLKTYNIFLKRVTGNIRDLEENIRNLLFQEYSPVDQINITQTRGMYILSIMKTSDNFSTIMNKETNIIYTLPEYAHIKVTVYDIRGAEIVVLKNGFEMSGYYNIQWNASQYSSGVYFIEMVSDNFREVRKIIHMK